MENIVLVKNIKEKDSVFGVKIEATGLAYNHLENQVMCWENESSSYCHWGDNMTVDGEVDESFIKFMSPKTVLINSENSDKLNLKILQHGKVMKKQTAGKITEIEKVYFDGIKQAYNLFVKSGMSLEYEGFLLDTSHKLRNGLGSVSCIYEDNKMIAVALCSYITKKHALISAVAVDENFRNKGYGRKVLEELEKKLNGRTLYLLKEDGENDIFYNKLNYVPTESWVLGEYDAQLF